MRFEFAQGGGGARRKSSKGPRRATPRSARGAPTTSNNSGSSGRSRLRTAAGRRETHRLDRWPTHTTAPRPTVVGFAAFDDDLVGDRLPRVAGQVEGLGEFGRRRTRERPAASIGEPTIEGQISDDSGEQRRGSNCVTWVL